MGSASPIVSAACGSPRPCKGRGEGEGQLQGALTLGAPTPHLNSLPFHKRRGGASPADPKLTINEKYQSNTAVKHRVPGEQ